MPQGHCKLGEYTILVWAHFLSPHSLSRSIALIFASYIPPPTFSLGPNDVTNLRFTSSERTGSTNRVRVQFSWDGPSGRSGPYRYRLSYSASQVFPYPPTRSNSTSADSIDLDGESLSFPVPESDSLPFADFTVRIFAYNIKRGLGIRSGETTITQKSIPICKF